MVRFAALCCAVLLSACSAVVPGTLAQVARLDPLTADPNAVALRVELPAGLAVRPGSARLELSAARGARVLGGVFALEARDGIWRIAPQDTPAFRQAQSGIAAWKVEDPRGTVGTLSVRVDPCLTRDTLPEDATGSVYIRTEAGGDFLPLLRDAPLNALTRDAPLAPCS